MMSSDPLFSGPRPPSFGPARAHSVRPGEVHTNCQAVPQAARCHSLRPERRSAASGQRLAPMRPVPATTVTLGPNLAVIALGPNLAVIALGPNLAVIALGPNLAVIALSMSARRHPSPWKWPLDDPFAAKTK